MALTRLFGFGHVQSDDIQAKKPAPIFLRNVAEELRTHDIVIADKCARSYYQLVTRTKLTYVEITI